jgi:hypothetical protein
MDISKAKDIALKISYACDIFIHECNEAQSGDSHMGQIVSNQEKKALSDKAQSIINDSQELKKYIDRYTY